MESNYSGEHIKVFPNGEPGNGPVDQLPSTTSIDNVVLQSATPCSDETFPDGYFSGSSRFPSDIHGAD